MWAQKGNIARCWIGRLPFRGDLLLSLEEFAAREKIRTAWVEVIGAVEKAVVGFYNQRERKYEQLVMDEEMEIISCNGNLSLREGRPRGHLHISLGDGQGHLKGGHLMEGTVVFAGEFYIREISGPELVRGYDADTGLPLWMTWSSRQGD